MLRTTASSVAISSPSSRINPQEMAWHGAADRHVVGGAADRQLADIAAGEKQWVS